MVSEIEDDQANDSDGEESTSADDETQISTIIEYHSHSLNEFHSSLSNETDDTYKTEISKSYAEMHKTKKYVLTFHEFNNKTSASNELEYDFNCNLVERLELSNISLASGTNIQAEDLDAEEANKRQIEEGSVVTEFAESCVNLDINVTGSEPLPLGVVPPKVLTKTVMGESHYKCLLDFYDAAYPGAMALGLLNSDLVAPPFGARWPTTSVYIEKFVSIRLGGKTFNSAETRSPSGSCIQSLFVGQNHEKVEAWPGKDLVFAFVRFFKPLNNTFYANKYKDQGLEVWQSSYSDLCRDSVVPISRIYSPIALAKKPSRDTVDDNNNDIVNIPLQRNVFD
ncbi:hypothetical protein INT47_011330 [Mucor saturninus]|uniref:Uncharacterized protein n=1 Tax=Mucor saturninus TaxID=64648 RepID=A0A8H7RNX8_9FUNG|nr:hypothetical protein INT47_011330 [Mucor saturninus]